MCIIQILKRYCFLKNVIRFTTFKSTCKLMHDKKLTINEQYAAITTFSKFTFY